MIEKKIEQILKDHQPYHHVVPFDSQKDKLLQLDFTENNTELNPAVLNDTSLFSEYVFNKLSSADARYGIGGYNEHRTIYSRSEVFDGAHPSRLGGTEGKAISAQPLLKQDDDIDLINSLNEPEKAYGYHWADPLYYSLLKEYALKHRSNPTQAETLIWELIKSKKLKNYKFRRQHIIGKYITDFVCLDKKLVIEIDGLIHQMPENQESDKIRTNYLQEKGFIVVRYSNEEVINNYDKVLKEIVDQLEKQPSSNETSKLSSPFGGQGAAPRRLHLGIDIWGAANTPVYAPTEAIVHSFSFNDAFGDYGATLILKHEIDGFIFHTLYGHLSLASIQEKQEGEIIQKGSWIAAFGEPLENGDWPPHLHFQIILDMQGKKGDYPGVCQYSTRESFLLNSPDPDMILQMMQYAL